MSKKSKTTAAVTKTYEGLEASAYITPDIQSLADQRVIDEGMRTNPDYQDHRLPEEKSEFILGLNGAALANQQDNTNP